MSGNEPNVQLNYERLQVMSSVYYMMLHGLGSLCQYLAYFDCKLCEHVWYTLRYKVIREALTLHSIPYLPYMYMPMLIQCTLSFILYVMVILLSFKIVIKSFKEPLPANRPNMNKT